ncbi:MAG: bifunctional DNA-formamidopyrimidine glycosylase/DNA-(apurinic or apyrimidinic site) lyase [Pseudomonadota bacterium]
MPELPEVETTLRGILPRVQGRRILALELRQPALRWPVPAELPARLPGQRVRGGRRRGKYLLLHLDRGHLLLHLGMSGSLRLVAPGTPAGRHDHFDLALEDGVRLRFTDPRRFGALLWVEGDPLAHPLLRELGPEPLEADFDADYLFRRARGRRVAIKSFLMDSRIVVGIGNIYANEILYLAGVHPARAAGRIARQRHQALVAAAKEVLAEAVTLGGTTLRDFVGGDGRPGYFRQQLRVYGRAGLACPGCATPLREVRLAQRATVYCPRCQR